MNGIPNTDEPHFVECACGYYEFIYTPLPFQKAFHESATMIKGYFGGFGAGKTTSGGAEFIAHVMNVPNGLTLIGAATIAQMMQTCKKFIDDVLPVSFIESTSRAPNNYYYHLINGHRILFKVLDDEGKIRSLNLTG
jgi:phage terminase large subunit